MEVYPKVQKVINKYSTQKMFTKFALALALPCSSIFSIFAAELPVPIASGEEGIQEALDRLPSGGLPIRTRQPKTFTWLTFSLTATGAIKHERFGGC
jgi:hypothetical protein